MTENLVNWDSVRSHHPHSDFRSSGRIADTSHCLWTYLWWGDQDSAHFWFKRRSIPHWMLDLAFCCSYKVVWCAIVCNDMHVRIHTIVLFRSSKPLLCPYSWASGRRSTPREHEIAVGLLNWMLFYLTVGFSICWLYLYKPQKQQSKELFNIHRSVFHFIWCICASAWIGYLVWETGGE